MEVQWSEHFLAEKPAPARYQQCLICPKCNFRSCRFLKSSTDKNPDRWFYICPAPADDHKFFKWADKVRPDELIQVPNCGGCSAGICRVRRVNGRIMFTCRVKEGEGSCGYRVWQDELEMSETGQEDENMNLSRLIMENCNKTTDTVTDMVNDSKHRDEGTDTVPPLLDHSDALPYSEVFSEMDHEVIGEPHFLNEPETSSRKMDHLKCLEDKSDIISMRPHKRSRYRAKDLGFPISASFLTASMALNSMPTRHCWMEDAICQSLSTELNGWWGRLAFHPMPCLMTCLVKPSTSFVSYPRDPTFLLQDIWVNSSGSAIPARNSRGAESYTKLSFNLEQHHNPVDSSFVVQDNILVNSSDAATLVRHRVMGAESYSKPFVTKGQRHCIMSNAFHQAAECLQNELLSRLEAMDAKDHETMSQAAEDTFAALDCLLFDHQDFKRRAKELIHCASSLVEMELSMPTNDSCQKLVEISSERVRLDEISCVHAEAMEALVSNMKSLKVMQEEISSTIDGLLQIQAKVCCYEVKMTNLELELEEIAKNKEVLERKYLIESKELEESQKEAEHNAAKAAFERARALLRG